ncbi:hypothetical protein WR25_12766 isoform A [Diploscapter pachys]|uniref:Bestrophin homolog n=1 Tax=Diploscapter pachys TaxID=2018661 RepID=A0A2A2L3L9_9BILA|nr:hypothetical protein WR25_12766 isoform A [Diploscapter pachys]
MNIFPSFTFTPSFLLVYLLIDVTFCLQAPVLIVLSFVTKIVLTRWQSVYLQLLWPENVALTLKYFINEHMPDSRPILTVAQRYFLLCAALVFRDVNVQIRDHYFPTYESFIEKGLLTKEEKDIMFSTQLKPSACRYWFPLLWIIQLVKKRYNAKRGLLRTRKEALILEKHYCELVNAINDYRAGISDIMSYDFIPIPLALTQLFTFFIYSTLFLGIFSFQSRVFDSMQAPDASLFTVLSIQFISAAMFNLFFIGWLRIAHIILNPFGEDDDDFPMCELLEQYCDSLYQILCVPTDVPIYKKGDKALIPKLRHTVASAFLK